MSRILVVEDESAIAEMLRELQARHTDVYVKSRAHSFEAGDQVRATLTAAGRSDEEAQRMVDAAFADLGQSLERMGIAILS